MNTNATSITLPQDVSDHFDVSKSKYITLANGDSAFAVVRAYLGKNESTQHFGFSREKKTSTLSGHLGLHKASHDGKPLFVYIQTHGAPVGTGCSAEVYQTMTVFDPAGSGQFIQSFLDALIDESEKSEAGLINVYSWHMRYQYWEQGDTKRKKRMLDSIILPVATKEHVVGDIERFLAPDAAEWYAEHCIPYKRNFLFTGPPGTGKSSFITALASQFDRNICFMQPCHKDMTDEHFKKALARLPLNSVLVLEDIDSLFTSSRQGLQVACPLTFSGLLNGLDGLGSPTGQLIMMTTNHVERLDPALLRVGRVDCRAELSLACREQLLNMFLAFYPGNEKEAGKFCTRLSEEYPDGLSLAAVQNHFIYHRANNAETASELGSEDLMRLKCNQPLGDDEKKEEDEKDKKEQEETEGKTTAADNDDVILKCIDYFEKIMELSDPKKEKKETKGVEEERPAEQKEATCIEKTSHDMTCRLGSIKATGPQIFTMFVGFCLASKLFARI